MVAETPYPDEAVEIDWATGRPLRLVEGDGLPDGDDSGLDEDSDLSVTGQDKRRLERVRDCLIDAEDELLYVVKRQPELQHHVDVIVRTLIEISKMAEGMRP